MARIIVVDDDPDVVDLVSMMLRPDHEVEGTTQPETALQRISNGDYHLLVTDVRMPTMSGFQLVEQVRRQKPKMNVLLISAYYDETDPLCRDVMSQYGTMAISKPLDRLSVRTMVDWCLMR